MSIRMIVEGRIMRLNLSPFREESFSFAEEDIPQR
jgi:hypothetical protein